MGILAAQTATGDLQLLPHCSDELVLAIPAGYPLASRSNVVLRDALQYEFIGPHLDSSLHAMLSVEAMVLGLVMQQRILISSFDCMSCMIATGMSIGILPRGILGLN